MAHDDAKHKAEQAEREKVERDKAEHEKPEQQRIERQRAEHEKNQQGAPSHGQAPEQDRFTTEQEKSADKDGGVGPADKAVGTPGPVKTIDEEGIGVRQPYPTGNPPVPERDKPQPVKGNNPDERVPNQSADKTRSTP